MKPMEWHLEDLLHEDVTLVGLQAASDTQAISVLVAALAAADYVAPQFAADVLARERTFPTGLPTEPIGVAIPHADPDHVYRSAIAVGLLTEPVTFKRMGSNSDSEVAAQLVFLLAIKEIEKQVELIRELMAVLQNGDVLEAIARQTDAAGVLSVIETAGE